MPSKAARSRTFGKGKREFGWGSQSNFARPRKVDSKAPYFGESTNRSKDEDAKVIAAELDEGFGFHVYEHGPKKTGWLINMHATEVVHEESGETKAAVDYYFLDDDGSAFKATFPYKPYFLVASRPGRELEVEEYLRRKFEGLIRNITRVEKDDLQSANHLVGNRSIFLKLDFDNVSDFFNVRRSLQPIIESNKKSRDAIDTYAEMLIANRAEGLENRSASLADTTEYMIDMREYDVPYHVRVAIDNDIRIGKWYTVEAKHGVINIAEIPDRIQRADPVVMAFDIETTKLPLKFPDALIDQVMMISYMIDGEGFLITNREIVSQDIDDFEYTPRPEFHGPFTIFNEENERATLQRFFDHIKEARPTVIVTYNGDFFDWPFVETRALVNGIDMYGEIGFAKDSEDEYKSNHCAHMDAFRWVKRDSYLPQGSQGLKAVTTVKLGYDPDELDPESMTRYAQEQPQTLAEYSVSDAVATYYLYMKYVHPFIFSLCNIIPLKPDEVLRKGTGTLCEMLLMVQAYQKQIILPNKYVESEGKFHEGRLLESETYVGGHVESLEAGVFRSDIPVDFKIDPSAIDELVQDLDKALKFTIEVEAQRSLADITDYTEVKNQILEKLFNLRQNPVRNECPSIYHLDVASMYPNIMTSNRLQPDSMIREADCAACDFNRPGKTCDRRLPWSWRGEFFPAKRDEYNMVLRALQNETFPGRYATAPKRRWEDLAKSEQAVHIKKRLTEYCKKIYHKVHQTQTVEKEAIVCQRENPFYVDTVKSFRDRRYDYKGKQKDWKRQTDDLVQKGAELSSVDEAKKMVVLYDSLQLAHKVILNSFYGYVMRKGSRWYSMEMAGVTCLTGASIIQMARKLVERIGRPLELDTDGIWCIFPQTFPENFAFTTIGGKKLSISFPCVMLNHLVQEKFTNHQYQELTDVENFRYTTHSENSIFFEVDGPYRAMILPASKEEDINLKKRYAVFNENGTLAELKGFEVKRRGELKLIKIFQTQIFRVFLEGSSLESCYGAVAKVANRWLDLLLSKGSTLVDEELIELICENRSMSRTLEEYGAQKSTSISTARRLAEFLGEQMVKDKGLSCKFIISSKPRGSPVTERAIPVAIFSADEPVKKHFLRKWLHDNSLTEYDPRDIIDWNYYLERLGSVIQKLITIPAAMQKIDNPVPRIHHPEWLQRRVNAKNDVLKQVSITTMFARREVKEIDSNTRSQPLVDIEDTFGNAVPVSGKHAIVTKLKRKQNELQDKDSDDPFAALPDTMPPLDGDYVAWLAYQKQKWKIQKRARERRRFLFGARATTLSNGVVSFFRGQSELLFTKTWQLIQLRETEIPGDLRAWIVVDQSLHHVRIKVQRHFYLNLKSSQLPDVEIPGCTVERVHHILPNGHASVYLFQLSMTETVFQNERVKLSNLLRHPSVEGVYEMNVDPTTRALLHLGATCTFDETLPGLLGKGLEHGFALSNLKRKQMKGTYLSHLPFRITLLYHVVVNGRSSIAVISSDNEEADIFIVMASRDGRSMPNVDVEYAKQISQYVQSEERDEAFRLPNKVHFSIDYLSSMKQAYKRLSSVMKKLRNDVTAPRLLLIQSPDVQKFERNVDGIFDCPVLHVPVSNADTIFPALGWEQALSKQLVSRFIESPAWLASMINMSRYGDIPLCQLQGPNVDFLIDVNFARRLQDNNIILWWSDQPLPNHGFHERDDILNATEQTSIKHVNKPGAYTSVCIDVDIRNLGINSLLTSSLVDDLDGIEDVATSLNNDNDGDENEVSLTENSFASPAIAVLRSMVRHWWDEACRGETNADLLVHHLVHWTSSSRSYLFDNALHRFLLNSTGKAFHQLMSEFKKIGSDIVFGSTNRLVLHTSKSNVGNAYAYSQYIVKRIKSLPLFHFLDLEIKEFWDCLLWMDNANYGGKSCTDIREAEEQDLKNIGHWQIQAFLPEILQTEFSEYVARFVELLHVSKAILPAQSAMDAPSSTIRLTQLPTKVNDEGQITLLDETFQKTIVKRTAMLLRRYANIDEDDTEFRFPEFPGSDAKIENPVLHLVQSMCAVFSLTKDMSSDVQILKRELLQLFDIREFSKKANFQNPSESLTLCHYVCQYCGTTRDFDFGRDEDLVVMGDHNTVDAAWRCNTCSMEYNRLAIEESLIAQFHRDLTAYQLQDIACSKCRRARADNMDEHCTCSGKWERTLSRNEILRKFEVYQNIGEYYNMKMLHTLVEGILRFV